MPCWVLKRVRKRASLLPRSRRFRLHHRVGVCFADACVVGAVRIGKWHDVAGTIDTRRVFSPLACEVLAEDAEVVGLRGEIGLRLSGSQMRSRSSAWRPPPYSASTTRGNPQKPQKLFRTSSAPQNQEATETLSEIPETKLRIPICTQSQLHGETSFQNPRCNSVQSPLQSPLQYPESLLNTPAHTPYTPLCPSWSTPCSLRTVSIPPHNAPYSTPRLNPPIPPPSLHAQEAHELPQGERDTEALKAQAVDEPRSRLGGSKSAPGPHHNAEPRFVLAASRPFFSCFCLRFVMHARLADTLLKLSTR